MTSQNELRQQLEQRDRKIAELEAALASTKLSLHAAEALAAGAVDPSDNATMTKKGDFMKEWNEQHSSLQGKRGVVKERAEAWESYEYDYTKSRREILGVAYRRSDTQKHLCLQFVRSRDEFQKPWTKKHELAMCNIFGISNMQTCIITGKRVSKSAAGDHVYDVCGRYRSHSILGSDHPCNHLPIVGSLNAGYKIFPRNDTKKPFKCSGVRKNIGFQTLTKEEQGECSPNDLALYQKFQKRREYLTDNSFKDRYFLTDAEKSAIEDALNGMYNPSAPFFTPFITAVGSLLV
jgi:hypothetical protein